MVTAKGRYTRGLLSAAGAFIILGLGPANAQGALPTIVPEDADADIMICDDLDDDGVLDALDNCVGLFNPAQRDSNGNGIGDACEKQPSDS